MVEKKYLIAIKNKFKDYKVTKMYDAGNGSILFMIATKDGKPMVDNVHVINKKLEITGYPIVKNPKEFQEILKHPLN